MINLLIALVISAAVCAGIFSLCRETGGAAGPSWFDLLPYLRPSKKARGRGER